jgi:hypothetical protein
MMLPRERKRDGWALYSFSIALIYLGVNTRKKKKREKNSKKQDKKEMSIQMAEKENPKRQKN